MTELKSLVIDTVVRPAEAAQRVLQIGVSRDVVWIGFGLGLVLNAILLVAIELMYGPLENPVLGAIPTSYVVLLMGAMLISGVMFVVFIGRWLGSTADFHTVFKLVVWLRLIYVGTDFLGVVLALISVPMSLAFNVIAMCYGLYVIAHFVNQGLGLGSLAKSFGVLFMAAVAILAAMMVLLGVFVPGTLEASHV